MFGFFSYDFYPKSLDVLFYSTFFFFFLTRTRGKESREAGPYHLPPLVWLVPILVSESNPLEGLFWRSFGVF